MANCLERGIVGALLHMEWRASLKPPMARTEYEAQCEAFEAACAKLPMGRLVKRLRQEPDVSAELHRESGAAPHP